MVYASSYIDGFNLYHAIESMNKPWLKWLNLRSLSESFLSKEQILTDVNFFTAYSTWDSDKRKRHRNYIEALGAYGVTTHFGKFQKIRKACRKTGNSCDFYEEKHTDVAFSVKVISDAYEDKFDIAILITSDADQLPTVQLIKKKFPNKGIIVAAPPGRLRLARDLGNAADKKLEIKEGRMVPCQLPRNVESPDGKFIATMPSEYRHPPW